MSLGKINADYVPLQIKVFSRWTANKLMVRSIPCTDVTKDLLDGTILMHLAEILTGKTPPRRWTNPPKFAMQKVQNCDLAIEMFTADGVKIIGISGKDISDGNVTLTLGLIWMLILRYSIQMVNDIDSDGSGSVRQSATQKLMGWALKTTAGYEGVENFKPLPVAFCALLNNYVPDMINFGTLDRTDLPACAKLVCNTCEKIGIPILLDWEDLVGQVDEKTLCTQISMMKKEFKRRISASSSAAGNIGVFTPIQSPGPTPLLQQASQESNDDILIKVFSRWTSNKLLPKNILVEDITKETHDGTVMMNLAEILTKMSQKWEPKPTTDDQKLNNCNTAIELFKRDGVSFDESVEGKGITEKNVQVILELFWSLIVKYSIKSANSFDINQKDSNDQNLDEPGKLLAWAKRATNKYSEVNDFKPTPLAFVAILDTFVPKQINYVSINKNDQKALSKLICQTCTNNGIPLLLDWEDFGKLENQKVIAAQLALIKTEFMFRNLLIKVFSRWTQSKLASRNITITDITKDVHDGTVLVNLAEVLTHLIPENKWEIAPKDEKQMAQNIDLSVNLFKYDKVTFIDQIESTEIINRNVVMILNMIWSLILKYSIDSANSLDSHENEEYGNGTQKLLEWAYSIVQKYPEVRGFKSIPLALCAILNEYAPQQVNFSSLDKTDDRKCSEVAVQVMNEIGVPAVLDVNDLASLVDERAFITQISLIKKECVLRSNLIKYYTKWVNSIISQRSISIDDVTQDLNDGTVLVILSEILTKNNVSFEQNPSNDTQKVKNNETGINLFKRDGAKFSPIVNAKKITQQNTTSIFSLISTLIQKYSISKANSSYLNSIEGEIPPEIESASESLKLMHFANDEIKNYLELHGFKKVPLALCAYLNGYAPDQVNFKSLHKDDDKANAELVCKVLEDNGIPCLFDPDDLLKPIDEGILCSQLALIKNAFSDEPEIVSRDVELNINDDELEKMKQEFENRLAEEIQKREDAEKREEDEKKLKETAEEKIQELLNNLKHDESKVCPYCSQEKESREAAEKAAAAEKTKREETETQLEELLKLIESIENEKTEEKTKREIVEKEIIELRITITKFEEIIRTEKEQKEVLEKELIIIKEQYEILTKEVKYEKEKREAQEKEAQTEKSKREEAEKEIEKLKKALSESSDSNSAEKAIKDQLEKDIADGKAKMEEFEKNLQLKKEEIEKLQKELKEERNKTELKDKEIEEEKSKRENSEKAIEDEKSKRELTERIVEEEKSKREEAEKEIERLQKELKEERSKTELKDKEIEEEKSKRENSEKSTENEKSKREEAEKEIEKLKKVLSESSDSNSAEKAIKDQLEKDIADGKAKMEEFEKNLQLKKEEIEKLQKELKEERNKTELKDKEIEEEKSKRENSEKSTENEKSKREEAEKEIERLQKELKEEKSKTELKDKEIEEEKSKRENSEKAIEDEKSKRELTERIVEEEKSKRENAENAANQEKELREAIEKELENIRNTLAQSSDSNTAEKALRESLEKEIAYERSKIEELEKELATEKDKAKSLNKLAAQEKDKREAAEKTIEDLKNSSLSEKKKLEAAQKAIKAEKSKTEAAEKQCDEQKQIANNLSDQLEKLKGDYNRIKEAETLLAKEKSLRAANEKAVNECKSKSTLLGKEIDELKKKLEKSESERQKCQLKLNELEADNKKLNEAMKRMIDQKKNDNSSSSSKTDQQTLDRELQIVLVKEKELRIKIEKEMSDQKQLFTKLTKENNNLKKTIEQLENENMRLKTDANKASKTNKTSETQLNNEILKEKALRESIEKKLNDSNSSSKYLANELDTLKKQYAQLEIDYKKVNQRLTTCKEAYEKTYDQLSKLKEIQEEADKREITHKSKIAEYEKTLKELNDKIKKLENTHSQAALEVEKNKRKNLEKQLIEALEQIGKEKKLREEAEKVAQNVAERERRDLVERARREAQERDEREAAEKAQKLARERSKRQKAERERIEAAERIKKHEELKKKEAELEKAFKEVEALKKQQTSNLAQRQISEKQNNGKTINEVLARERQEREKREEYEKLLNEERKQRELAENELKRLKNIPPIEIRGVDLNLNDSGSAPQKGSRSQTSQKNPRTQGITPQAPSQSITNLVEKAQLDEALMRLEEEKKKREQAENNAKFSIKQVESKLALEVSAKEQAQKMASRSAELEAKERKKREDAENELQKLRRETKDYRDLSRQLKIERQKREDLENELLEAKEKANIENKARVAAEKNAAEFRSRADDEKARREHAEKVYTKLSPTSKNVSHLSPTCSLSSNLKIENKGLSNGKNVSHLSPTCSLSSNLKIANKGMTNGKTGPYISQTKSLSNKLKIDPLQNGNISNEIIELIRKELESEREKRQIAEKEISALNSKINELSKISNNNNLQNELDNERKKREAAENAVIKEKSVRIASEKTIKELESKLLELSKSPKVPLGKTSKKESGKTSPRGTRTKTSSGIANTNPEVISRGIRLDIDNIDTDDLEQLKTQLAEEKAKNEALTKELKTKTSVAGKAPSTNKGSIPDRQKLEDAEKEIIKERSARIVAENKLAELQNLQRASLSKGGKGLSPKNSSPLSKSNKPVLETRDIQLFDNGNADNEYYITIIENLRNDLASEKSKRESLEQQLEELKKQLAQLPKSPTRDKDFELERGKREAAENAIVKERSARIAAENKLADIQNQQKPSPKAPKNGSRLSTKKNNTTSSSSSNSMNPKVQSRDIQLDLDQVNNDGDHNNDIVDSLTNELAKEKAKREALEIQIEELKKLSPKLYPQSTGSSTKGPLSNKNELELERSKREAAETAVLKERTARINAENAVKDAQKEINRLKASSPRSSDVNVLELERQKREAAEKAAQNEKEARINAENAAKDAQKELVRLKTTSSGGNSSPRSNDNKLLEQEKLKREAAEKAVQKEKEARINAESKLVDLMKQRNDGSSSQSNPTHLHTHTRELVRGEPHICRGIPMEGGNKRYVGKLFTFKISVPVEGNGTRRKNMAITFIEQGLLNECGMKLSIEDYNPGNIYQLFKFGENDHDTIISSVKKEELVFDVADHYNWNPPEGTPFYLFPCHGRHNQHFVYKDGMIYAKQNGQVVTYVGGQYPLVMMWPTPELKSKQTFELSAI